MDWCPNSMCLMKFGLLIFSMGMVSFFPSVSSNKIFSMGTRHMKVLSIEQTGETLKVKPGESFLLILPDPGSGGYVVRDTPEFDSGILVLVKMERKPPSDSRRAGDFGSLEWTFRAKKEGVSPIVIRASRPWEREKASVIIFETSVLVTE